MKLFRVYFWNSYFIQGRIRMMRYMGMISNHCKLFYFSKLFPNTQNLSMLLLTNMFFPCWFVLLFQYKLYVLGFRIWILCINNFNITPRLFFYEFRFNANFIYTSTKSCKTKNTTILATVEYCPPYRKQSQILNLWFLFSKLTIHVLLCTFSSSPNMMIL